MAASVRREPWLGLLMAGACAVYTLYSLLRFAHLESAGHDLAIFDQTVWHYSRFETPANTVRGFDNIWGDHFSPVLVLFAPFYWVHGDPRILLVGQAVLLAAGAIPVFLYAQDRLGRVPAYALAFGYLAFWGVQSAVAFDFHEFAFAPVAIGATLLALRSERWGWYAAGVVFVLCIKEDMAVLVVFLGIYALTLGHRRAGLATIGAGVVWYVLIVKLLIPHNNPHGYEYWNYTAFGDDAPSAVVHALTHPWQVVDVMTGNSDKRHTLLLLFLPLLGLALLSRTTILMVPLVLERLLSSRPVYWTTEFHYTLPMAAILFFAAADGLSTLRARPRIVLAATAAIAAVNIAVTLTFDHGWRELLDRDSYRTPPGVPAATAALAVIPEQASVAAVDRLLPRLAERDLAAEVGPSTGATDYAVANVLDERIGAQNDGGPGGQSRYMNQALGSGVPVAYHSGWLVVRARRLGPAPRPPALRAAVGADADRLRAAATGWTGALASYVPSLYGCGGQPDVAGCVHDLEDLLPPAQDALLAALEPVGSQLTPDCGALAALAVKNVRELGVAVARVRAAAIAGDSALPQRNDALKVLHERDAEGYLPRFVTLCVAA